MTLLCKASFLVLNFFYFLQVAHAGEGLPGGWLWYKEPTVTEKKPLEKKKDDKKEDAKLQTYADRLKQVRETFEESLAESILYPNLKNVQKTKLLHDQILSQSQNFSDLWVLASILNGEERGANTHAQKIQREMKEDILKGKIRKLAKTRGLFFAFRGDCPYCHKFAPIVKNFAEEFGFELKPVSGDGGMIEGLKNTSKDNGILKLLNPSGSYPALILANPTTMEVITIGVGLMSWSQLLQNFEYVIDFMEKRRGRN